MGSSPSHANGPSSSRGCTKNHPHFTSEQDRFQRKASGAVPAGTVTIKVVLAQPETKGAKVVYMAIDPVGVFERISFLPFDLLCRTSPLAAQSLLLLELVNFARSAFQQCCQNGFNGPRGINFQLTKLKLGTRGSWSQVIGSVSCSIIPRRPVAYRPKPTTFRLFLILIW